MAYTGPDDPNLPASIRGLPARARRQWLSLYESAVARGLPDARALRVASGIIEALSLELSAARIFDSVSWSVLPDAQTQAYRSMDPALHENYDYGAAPYFSSPILDTLTSVPTRVAATLPEEAQAVWLEAYNMAALLGCDRYHCENVAWKAVDQAGYAPPTEKWTKVRESRGGDALDSPRTLFTEDTTAQGPRGSVWDVILITSGMSANRRRYSESTLRKAAPMFESAKAYADHPTKADLKNRSGNRSVTELVGWYSDVRFDESLSAIVGKLHVLESAAWLRSMLTDLADSEAPALIGLSINAEGEQKTIREGEEIIRDVLSITKVHSVDVVTEPAAGGTVVRLVASKQEEDTFMDLEKLRAAIGKMSHAAGVAFIEALDATEDEKALLRESLVAEDPPATGQQGTGTGTGTGTPLTEDRQDPNSNSDPATSTSDPLREEVQSLKSVLQAMRKSTIRSYATARLAESRLPKPSKDALSARIDSLLERRESDEAEVDAMLKEATDLWAAFEQHAGSGAVRNPDGSRIAQGAGDADKLVAALDGMWANTDAKLGDETIPRFRSLKEAYSRWTGKHPFDITPFDIMRESRSSYDSGADGLRLLESMTTASWAEVFSDRMYRRMLQEYRLPGLDEWRKIVSNIESVTDFRTQRRERVGGYGLLPDVDEGETYETLDSPTDEEATYAITKRGGLDDITFEMIVNDDLRNIRNIPSKLARAARQTLHRFVWDLLKDGFSGSIYDGNALFDNTNHANVAGGSSALELSDAGLQDGWQRMRSQQPFDNSTEHLGQAPRYLVVPNELEQLAWRLTRSAVTILGANFNATEPNFFQGRLEPIVIDYFTDANNWFLVADPANIPTIEVGFLNGQEEPELFVQDQPNVGSVMTADKITYKVRHIYSGVVLDYRGFVGSNPA